MKKIIMRSAIYILLTIICITLGVIGYLNKPTDLPDNKILNIDYYKYDSNTGNYDKIKITKETIEYNGGILDINSCKNYTYTETTGIVKLTDCNKAFRIVGFTDEAIVINDKGDNHYFYKDKEKSFNGEFQRKYQMTLEAYRLQGENELNNKKIDFTKIAELINNDDLSFIYLKGNNCKNECIFFNKTFINFSSKNNLYYLDTTLLKVEDINSLLKIDNNFPKTLNEYNETYPQILIVGNKKYIDTIKINESNLNYEKYKYFADNYEVPNE